MNLGKHELKAIFQERQNIKNDTNKIVIDSRLIEQNDLFVALVGDNNDGHNFIKNAINNGAKSIICEYIPQEIQSNLDRYKNIDFIIVDNSLKALQQIAKWKREKLKQNNVIVIGITGNIGKTSTKEAIKVILSKTFKTYATQGNLNNHIGLPLTLANAPVDAEIVILEMGMNHIGEIDVLTKIAQPDIAVITTITPAHIGNFNNIHEVVKAKAEIFNGLNNNGIVVLNEENEFFEELKTLCQNQGNFKLLTFGSEHSNAYINSYVANSNFTTDFDIVVNNKHIKSSIAGIGRHNVFNLLPAIIIADKLGIKTEQIAEQTKEISIVSGRGNIENIVFNQKSISLINDSYNASPASLKEAIDILDEFAIKTNRRAVAIIGDMLELGTMSYKYHKDIVEHLIKHNITNVILVGNESKIIYDNLPTSMHKHHFMKTDELCKTINDFLQTNDIVMIKASRGLHFEKIISTLKENKQHNNK